MRVPATGGALPMTAIPLLRATALQFVLPAIGVAALLFVTSHLMLQPPASPPPPRSLLVTSGVAQSYAEAVTQADLAIVDASQRVQHMPGEWLPLEALARAQFDRARLTADLDSYIAARDNLARAFVGLEPNIGPHLSRAEFSLGVHRLAAAEADLDRVDHYAVTPDPDEAAQITAMRGDIAFYRGNYEGARRLYADAARVARSTGIDVRLANHAMRLGHADDALRYLDRAAAVAPTITPQLAARIALQRGMIERGRGNWDAATRHYDEALRLYPGWWQAEQQRAAMAALAGDMPGAIRRFERIAGETGLPEPMDALAALYRASGDGARSRYWSARARALWDKRLAALPEAFAAHAIDHHLAFGDPALALVLARDAAAARPYGETLVALANALLANGHPGEALTVLRQVDASGWVSAEQHLVAAQAQAMLGRGAEADRERARARAIDPHSSDRNPALLWFDH